MFRHQILVAIFGFVLTIASANAATIPITNAGFQDDDVGTSWGTDVTGWTDEGGSDRSITQYADSVGTDIPVIEGDQVLILDARATSGAIYQSVGTIAANTIYTLDITAGSRSATPLPATFEFGLYSGSGATPVTALGLRDQTDTTGLANNTQASQEFSIVWDSTGSASVGDDLFVRMAVTTPASPPPTRQVIFDDLSLTSAPVPEPTSVMLCLVGALGLLLIRRRK